MTARLKTKEVQRKASKAKKDAELIEDWVGSDVYLEMVLKAYKVLKYIWANKDEEGFWEKKVHQLANQMLIIIIFLNLYAGRCGGWELITRADMVAQLDSDLAQQCILLFEKHKMAAVYGTLKKWVPFVVMQPLCWYRELPLGDATYFITSHTRGGDMVTVSNILSCACTTLGHPGACPGTNYLRKLYHTYISSEHGED